MNYRLAKLLCISVVIKCVWSDVYLHNPRGSNNRWNGNARARNNANRMFDSQNNARGGYNFGSLYYHVGSTLQIEWTNQHSCGDQNNHCDLIIQYMCGNLVRDGTTTTTIPSNPAQCENVDCNEDRRYGMHEDFYSYTHCKLRTRNMRLFTADQNVGPAATQTRQNPQGTRFGYECAEERDYYPYWGPTLWRDIAVITNDVTRCDMYERESQNVKERYACKVGDTYLYQNTQKNPSNRIPITQEECEDFRYTELDETKNGTWERYDSHGISAPACIGSMPSRDNHLGNTLGGQHLSYNWTIPDHVNEHCALRLRYNISTTDYDRDNTTSINNDPNVGQPRGIGVDLWSRHGLTEAEGNDRGYELEGNPELDIFETDKLPLRLAVNTAQYGRTFQDRSHTFSIKARPADISSSSKILNVNVRGKRGNIVQVYPAVEYDFVPNTAIASSDDATYIHFQWTGSDNNPGNNDGQGRAGTDRSNVVLISKPVYTEGDPETYKASTFGQLGSSYPQSLDEDAFAAFDRDTRVSLAVLTPHLGGDMTELNDAGTYYDLGPQRITSSAATYNYMCTRNNNFSNRSQKGKLCVTNAISAVQTVDQRGGMITAQNSASVTLFTVTIPAGALSSPTFITVCEIEPEDAPFQSRPANTDFVSNFVNLSPVDLQIDSNNPVTVQFRLTGVVSALNVVNIYRSDGASNVWKSLSVTGHENGMVSAQTDEGGYFIATRSVAAGPVAGLVVGLLIAVLLIVGLVVACRKNKFQLKGFAKKV